MARWAWPWPAAGPSWSWLTLAPSDIGEASGSFPHTLSHTGEKAERKREEGRENAFASLCVCYYWSNLGIHTPYLVEIQISQKLVP